ncbi:unnamed protein product [Orchesella dallaii]|uniref:C2H2-type domain-containing protein n=1 Tax=Orchesella dallaii TaxID=48710 RepID=A0ABP1R467_9HEXA
MAVKLLMQLRASEFRKNDLEEGEHDPNNIPMGLSMAKEKEDMEVSDSEQDFSYGGSFGALRAAYADKSMSLPGSGGTQNLEAFAAIYDEPLKNENAAWSDREAVVVTAPEFRRSDLEGGEHYPNDMEVVASGHQPQAHDLCQQNNDTVLDLCDDISTFHNEEISDDYKEQVDKINAPMNERDDDPYFEMHSITEQEAILAVAAVTDEVESLSQPAPFTCPICPGAILWCRYSLGRHLKMVHKRILAYQCGRCKKRLHTIKGFKNHMYFIHGDKFTSIGTLLFEENVRYSCLDVLEEEVVEFPFQNRTVPVSPVETVMETSSPSFLTISGENNEDGERENSINEANAADVENSSQERLQLESPVGESQDETLNEGEEGQPSANSDSDITSYNENAAAGH